MALHQIPPLEAPTSLESTQTAMPRFDLRYPELEPDFTFQLDQPTEAVDGHALSALRDTKEYVEVLEQTGGGYHLDTLDLPSAHVILGAIRLEGSKLQDKYGISDADLERAQVESGALARYIVNKKTPHFESVLGTIDKAQVEQIEHDVDVLVRKSEEGDQVFDRLEATKAERNLATLWRDEKGNEDTLFTSNVADKETLQIMALSLEEMVKETHDPVESLAAEVALEQLAADPKANEVVRLVVHPERLKRVKIAAVLGPWAVRAASSFVRTHALATA